MFRFVTSQGKLITPESSNVTIEDLFPNLHRHQRFGGSTTSPFSVCQHSLFTYRLGRRMAASSSAWMACLLHDAHEAFTGDIPTGFKNASIRSMQEEIDAVILRSLGLPMDLLKRHRFIVKQVDRAALVAEGYSLMHDTFRDAFGLGRPPAEDTSELVHVMRIWDPVEAFKDTFDDLKALMAVSGSLSLEATATRGGSDVVGVL